MQPCPSPSPPTLSPLGELTTVCLLKVTAFYGAWGPTPLVSSATDPTAARTCRSEWQPTWCRLRWVMAIPCSSRGMARFGSWGITLTASSATVSTPIPTAPSALQATWWRWRREWTMPFFSRATKRSGGWGEPATANLATALARSPRPRRAQTGPSSSQPMWSGWRGGERRPCFSRLTGRSGGLAAAP